MREIKFRAKVENIVQPLDVLTIDFGNCVVCIVDPDRCNQQTFDWSEVEAFIQFTGLHDRTGRRYMRGISYKDIYTVFTPWKCIGNRACVPTK